MLEARTLDCVPTAPHAVTSVASGEDIPLRVEIVTDTAGLDAIAPAWRALEIRAADPLTYFQSFAWCRAWCAYHVPDPGGAAAGAGPAIRICTVWQGDRLVIVWPLMAVGSRHAIRRIVGLGEPHSQYGNLIVDPQFRRAGEPAAAIMRCWCSLRELDGAHLLVVDNAPDGSLPFETAATGSPDPARQATIEQVSAGVGAVFDLTAFADAAQYRASLKASTRRSRNKRRNRLAAQGEPDYLVCTPDDHRYADLVRTGIAMKRRWLAETGRATRALNLPNIESFLCALTNEPDGRAGAVAAALTLDGRPIAVEIGFVWHRRFYSWLGSFDWNLRDFSPGKVQLENAICWCIENGITHYDLLGNPATYKSDWSNGAEAVVSWRAAPTLKGRMYLGLWHDRLLPAAKASLDALPPALKQRIIPIAERQAVPRGMAGLTGGGAATCRPDNSTGGGEPVLIPLDRPAGRPGR